MGQPSFILKPSYDNLHNAAITMVREARSHGWISGVIAPARGGLFFGVIASHKLNVPLHVINYSSKKGAGDDKNHSNVLPELGLVDGHTYLLVDDICDSGNTLTEIADHYVSTAGIRIVTAVFHHKEGSCFDPEIYYWRIPKNSEFIEYPYEAS